MLEEEAVVAVMAAAAGGDGGLTVDDVEADAAAVGVTAAKQCYKQLQRRPYGYQNA